MIVHLHLQPLVTKGVRGLGKHLPVISSIGRSTEKRETYRNSHYDCPNLYLVK